MAEGNLTQFSKRIFCPVDTPKMARFRKRFFSLMDNGTIPSIEVVKSTSGKKMTIASDDIADVMGVHNDLVLLRLYKRGVLSNDTQSSKRIQSFELVQMNRGGMAYLFHGQFDLQLAQHINGQKSLAVAIADIDYYCPIKKQVQLNSEGEIPDDLCNDEIVITNMDDFLGFIRYDQKDIMTKQQYDKISEGVLHEIHLELGRKNLNKSSVKAGSMVVNP